MYYLHFQIPIWKRPFVNDQNPQVLLLLFIITPFSLAPQHDVCNLFDRIVALFYYLHQFSIINLPNALKVLMWCWEYGTFLHGSNQSIMFLNDDKMFPSGRNSLLQILNAITIIYFYVCRKSSVFSMVLWKVCHLSFDNIIII